MSESELDLDLDELSSAEDFLDYFGVAYKPAVVQVNRLHILQRFHDYLSEAQIPEDEAELREIYRLHLERAYRDFVESDALSEKVFQVFRMHEPQETFVPLAALKAQVKGATAV
jgi:nitrogenase-stabilizing/protective protein